MDIPHARVILLLREDYLYYLLECNNRLTSLEVINNNILDKDILYYLGNFSRQDTKALIESFTQTTKLFFESSLIKELVEDLAGDFGEIRPIELQVVGTQLQTEKTTTLEQYQERGPKEKLVGRFLEEVIKDCGLENQQIAKLVLYLLTDENNTRPLKTRADLELELEVKAEKLDLVLLILVKSGLVFKVPAIPADRYQLVHDYLVPFVRQQQSEGLIAELEKEREQRKLTEAKLNEVLKQQLLEVRRGLAWKVSLGGVIAGGLAILLPLVLVSQNNTQLISMSTTSQGLLRSEQDLEALVEILKAGKRLQQWWSIGVKPETKMQVVTALQDVVYSIRERNSLEGHSDSVTKVSLSPHGNMVVSGSADGTLIIWNRDGSKKVHPFKAHDNMITSVSFSPDSKMVVSGSKDKTVKLWSLDGKVIKIFKGHQDSITSVSFSQDSQKVVSGSEDGTIILWSLDGKVIRTFKGHQDSITSVSFSPDDQKVVSRSADGTIILWRSDGKLIKTLNQAEPNNILSFSPNGQIFGSGTKLWRRDGSFFKNLSNQERSNLSLNFSSDSQTIAVASSSGNRLSVNLSKIDTQDSASFVLTGHKNEVTSASFSPNLQMIASGSKDNTVKLWSLESRGFKTSDRSQVTDITFSPNGQIIASISNKLQLWGRLNGKPITTLPGSNSKVSVSANNQLLVSASQDSTVQLWRRDGTFIKTLQGEVVDGSFSPDGRTIALVRSDNTVELSSSDGKAIAFLKGHKKRVYKISFSPNGETLATVSKDKTIKLWRRDGTLITTLIGYNEISIGSQSIGFSSSGETLAILDGDNTVKFLRRDGKVIKILKSDQYMSVNFSPNGEILTISKGNDSIELWQVNGTFLTKLQPQGESGSITVLGFTPDSQMIVIQDGMNQVQFMRLDSSLHSTFDKAWGHECEFQP